MGYFPELRREVRPTALVNTPDEFEASITARAEDSSLALVKPEVYDLHEDVDVAYYYCVAAPVWLGTEQTAECLDPLASDIVRGG